MKSLCTNPPAYSSHLPIKGKNLWPKGDYRQVSLEAQNPKLCKDVCESYLFDGQPCTFSVPESAAAPQILMALSYCIAHSGKNMDSSVQIF